MPGSASTVLGTDSIEKLGLEKTYALNLVASVNSSFVNLSCFRESQAKPRDLSRHFFQFESGPCAPG